MPGKNMIVRGAKSQMNNDVKIFYNSRELYFMSDVFTIKKIAVFSLLDVMVLDSYFIKNNSMLSVVITCFKRMACSVLYRFQ